MPASVPVISAMSTSVLVSVNQFFSFGYFTDTVNSKYSNIGCGSRYYKIRSTPVSAAT